MKEKYTLEFNCNDIEQIIVPNVEEKNYLCRELGESLEKYCEKICIE